MSPEPVFVQCKFKCLWSIQRLSILLQHQRWPMTMAGCLVTLRITKTNKKITLAHCLNRRDISVLLPLVMFLLWYLCKQSGGLALSLLPTQEGGGGAPWEPGSLVLCDSEVLLCTSPDSNKGQGCLLVKGEGGRTGQGTCVPEGPKDINATHCWAICRLLHALTDSQLLERSHTKSTAWA